MFQLPHSAGQWQSPAFGPPQPPHGAPPAGGGEPMPGTPPQYFAGGPQATGPYPAGPHAPGPHPAASHPAGQHPVGPHPGAQQPGGWVAPAAPPRPNPLGFVSIALGALAIIGAILVFLRVADMSALPLLVLGIAGVVTGIIGVTRKGQQKVPAIVGLVLSALALVVPFGAAMLFTVLFA